MRDGYPGPVVPTEYWTRLGDGRRGFCYVRAREGGWVVLTAYGRSSGVCADPIEKKPLYHFLPGTAVLSFGTAGCNLGCKFCQNWDISKSRRDETLSEFAPPHAFPDAAESLGCRSVAFTYNDPVVFHEYAIDVAAACRGRGLKVVAMTAGEVNPAPRAEFYRHVDAANIDLKGFTEEFYRDVCGGHLRPVLDTLEYVANETDVWLEVTTLLIPGLNDSDRELGAMSEWYAEHLGPDVPWHFTAFHPDFRLTDRPPTPPETLRRARAIVKASGVRHVYVGNVHDPEGDSTYCHGCGGLLIGRDWFELIRWNLRADGACPSCGTSCPGVFEPEPGGWGVCRVPLRLRRREAGEGGT